MKIRNIAVGVVVGGVIFAGGVAAVAWQKGWSIRETVELGAGVIASKTSRHTIAVGIDAGIQGPLLTTPGKDYADDRQLALAAGYEVVQS